MASAQALENEYAQKGYATKNVIVSIVLAAVLHVVILSAYFILGSSKKMSAPATAAKTAEGDAPKGTPPAAPKDGTASTGDSSAPKPAADPKATKPPDEIKKSTDVAKPGEIPARPDTDIDEILKRK